MLEMRCAMGTAAGTESGTGLSCWACCASFGGGTPSVGPSEILCLADPILSRIADRDGTSLYPLIYPSRLGPLDMLSPPFAPFAIPPALLAVTGDANGSLVFHRPFSLPSSFASRLVGEATEAKAGTVDPEECERIIALAGSLSRPDGEDV